MAQNTIETVGQGHIESLANLLDIMRRQAEIIANRHYPNTEPYDMDKSGMRKRIESEFLRIMTNYVCWARPTYWYLDFCNETSGEFGIMFTGLYTCLVQCDGAGNVSGHS
jgi:hypothetical protein